jgi:uridine kinase
MDAAAVAEVALARWRARQGSRPFCIGIGGGSASGKSTLARVLAQRLEPLAVEIVNQDRFFKPRDELPRYPSPSRGRPWPDYNRPESFRTAELLACCRQLQGCDLAILEGILVLHDPELRALLDLRIYVEADADERIVRRIRRNLKAGHSLDDICDYYLESVRFQHQLYNAPTARHADLIVPGGAREEAERERLIAALVAVLGEALGLRAYL